MAQQRNYKRSWKNLLINKEYQLRLTLVLVCVSGVLMAGLGWWVMDQAHTATQVAINNVEGTRCEKPAWMSKSRRVVVDEITAMKPAGTNVAPVDPDSVPVPEVGEDKEQIKEQPDQANPPAGPKRGEAGEEGADGDAADSEEADSGDAADSEEGAGEEHHAKVTITSSDMELHPTPALDSAGEAAAALEEIDDEEKRAQEERYHECQLAKKAKVEDLRSGQALILNVLIGLGLLMVIGLAVYGIKMTHKVAGPLFKVSLYLRKLQDNTYDTVYNLRKGDHLVDFYEHFKAAHAGVTEMQKEDVEQLKAAIAAAEAAGLADKSPELRASIEKLKELLEDREGSIA